MTTITRRMASWLVISIFLMLIVASAAQGTHRRPGNATPLRVALVPTFLPCNTPDKVHLAPLDLGSCSNTRINSEILTMSPRGVASGFIKLTVYCTDGLPAPCDPDNGTDTEDVTVQVTQTDVLCAVGGVAGCTAAGADYSAPVVAQLGLRITDHANAGLCPNGSGSPPCVTATVQDRNFGFQVGCSPTTSANGATCQSNTSLDTILPGMVRELQRGVVSITSAGLLDMGPDGAVGGGCPLNCGTGDETRYADQSLFNP